MAALVGMAGAGLGGYVGGLLTSGTPLQPNLTSFSNSTSNSYPYTIVADPHATQAAMANDSSFLSAAIGALSRSYANTYAAASPYLQTAYGAMDQLMDSLGISRPSGGSSKVSQDQNDYQTQLAQYNASKAAHEQYQNAQQQYQSQLAEHNQQQKAFSDYQAQLQWAKGLKYTKDQFKAMQEIGPAPQSPGTAPVAPIMSDAAKAYLGMQAPTLATENMTNGADMQKQWYANLESNPAFQFNLQQGTQNQLFSAAANGGLISGNTLQNLSKFDQGLVSNTAQQQQQQYLAAMGQGNTALGAAGYAGTQYGNAAASAYNSTGGLMSQTLLSGNPTFMVGSVPYQTSQSFSGQGTNIPASAGGLAPGYQTGYG